MTSNTFNLPVLSAEGSLALYLREIKKFPMLEQRRRIYVSKKI